MRNVIAVEFDLPEDFRSEEFLAFHRRDGEALAEQVSAGRLRKGLCLEGEPALLELELAPGVARASLDSTAALDAQALENLARRMLGLTQPVETFEAAYVSHPELGPLLARQRGLRVPVTATPYEALVWAITGQQISVTAALSIRRRLLRALALTHPDGLLCHPDARALTTLDTDALGRIGYSRSKAAALHQVSLAIAAGELRLEDGFDAAHLPALTERLLGQRGIGPWTVSYTLLRGYGSLEGSLHGDVAVRRKLGVLMGRETAPDAETTRLWLAGFAPWQALVAAHLWAMPTASEGAVLA